MSARYYDKYDHFAQSTSAPEKAESLSKTSSFRMSEILPFTKNDAKRKQPSQKKAHVTIRGAEREKALLAQYKMKKTMTRICFAVIGIALIVVLVAFGPVIIVSDATKISQASAITQSAINEATALNQTLTVRTAALKSNTHIERIAKEELNMSPAAGKVMMVNISDSRDLGPRQNSDSTPIKSGFIAQVARLTVGEASTLLVGDVGISALR